MVSGEFMINNTEKPNKSPRPKYTIGSLFTDYDGKTYNIVAITGDIMVIVDAKGQEKMAIMPGGQ